MANRIKIDNSILKKQKKKEEKQTRKKQMSCQILIITEGEKTEPNYFNHFATKNNDYFVYEVECDGTGKNTMAVVNKAIELKESRSNQDKYDSVWAVFDKDGFPDNNFNSAIAKADANGVNVAWSNEAFELWYLYHFQNRITAMSRDEFKTAISKAVNNSGKWKSKTPYKYKKNCERNFEIMTTYGNMEQAIKNAEQQHQTFTDTRYAKHNPCTTVYKLVQQLLNRDEELIATVMEKINKQ